MAKMATCVICGSPFPASGNLVSQNGAWVELNWCPGCIEKDGKLCAEEASTPNPFIVTRPPYHILYPQKVPEEIRKKLLAYVPKEGKKHDRKQLEKLARKTFQDLLKGKI